MKHIAVAIAIVVVIVAHGEYDNNKGKRRTVRAVQVIAAKPVKFHKGKKKTQTITCI